MSGLSCLSPPRVVFWPRASGREVCSRVVLLSRLRSSVLDFVR